MSANTPLSLYEPFPHPPDRKREEDRAEGHEVERVPQKSPLEITQAERPGQLHEMGERKGESSFLHPGRKVFQGEERTAEEEHGGYEKEYGKIERIDAGNHGGKKHADRSEGNTAHEGERYDQENGGVVKYPEETYHGQHD